MPMFKKSRPEVLSLRLNEERTDLLERRRAALTAELGRPISLSEAVFLLIEAQATDVDRDTTLHELQRTPTASLDRIRKQWTSEHALGLAQWDLLAQYVQAGAEEERQVPPMVQPTVPSRESYLALLEAFTAVYQQRVEKVSPHAWSYFASLDGYHTDVPFSDNDDDQRNEEVMRLIAHRRDKLTTTAEPWEYPGNVGACLVTAIRGEGVDSTRLDRVLAPHWPVLWGLAARGHWIRQGRQPVRAAGSDDDDVRRRFLLPEPATLGDMTLSFASAGPELAAQLAFGGQRRFLLVVHRYSELVEFRAMLEAPTNQPWRGRHFSASASQGPAASARTVWLQRDLAIDFTGSEWTALRDLVRQAWASPTLQRWLQELALEYGEHG